AAPASEPDFPARHRMVETLLVNRNTSPPLSSIRQAAQKGPYARRRGRGGHTPKAGRRRTRSVRRSDERLRQRSRWAFFSSLWEGERVKRRWRWPSGLI